MDEKQLQFLYAQYGNSHGFKDYSEFKSLMSDGKSRELFFNETNKDLGFKDYSEFNHILGYDSKEVQQQSSEDLFNVGLNKEQIEAKKQGVIPQLPIDTKGRPIKGVAPKIGKLPDIKEAIDNEVNNHATKYQVTDPSELENVKENTIQEYKKGNLIPSLDNSGKSVMKKGGGFNESLHESYNQSLHQEAENNFLTTASKEKAIDYLNKPEISFVKERQTTPNGLLGNLGEFLGQNLSFLSKGTIGTIGGAALAPETGGASFGTFLATAKEMATSGYGGNLKKNYLALKEQGLDDSEAYEKAKKAALVGEASSLATGAVLAKSLPEAKNTEAVNSAVKGIVNTIKAAPKPILTAAGGSIASDIAAKVEGVNLTPDQILENATEAGKGMAVMHFGLGAMPHILTGTLETIAKVPNALRPQIENVVASAPREDVINFYKQQEENGIVPEGTAQQVNEHLSKFDEQKKVVDDLPIDEENKAVIASRLVSKGEPENISQPIELNPEITNERANTTTEEAPKEKQAEVIQPETTTRNKPSNEPITTEEISTTEKGNGETLQSQPEETVVSSDKDNSVVGNDVGFKPGVMKQPSVLINADAADNWLKGAIVNETGQKRLDRLNELETVVNKSRASDADKKLSIDAINRERESLLGKEQSKKDNSIVENKEPEPTKTEQPTEEVAIQEPTTETEPQQEEVTHAQGGEVPPIGQPPLSTTIHVENPKTILTHKGLQEIATEIGGEDVTPRQRESRLSQMKEADNVISKWIAEGTYTKNVDDIIDRASKGKVDEVEQYVLANHLATLREERRNIANPKELKAKNTEIQKVLKSAQAMRSKAGGLLGAKAFGANIPKDYSNPISVQESVEHVTGEPINANQQKKIEELTAENATLKKQAADSEKRVIDETDKEFNKPNQTAPSKKGKYETKARGIAAKIMKAELPSWLKIDDPNAKTQGIGADAAKKLLADATIKMGKLLDSGIEFSKAVKEAVKDLVAAFGEDKRDEIEKGFAIDYKSNTKTQTAAEKRLAYLEKEKDKLLNGNYTQKSGKPDYKFTPEQKKQAEDFEEEIADLKEGLGLIPSKAEKPLTEEEQRQQDEKELSELQKQFENKKSTDKKFTPQQASDLWNYAKKNYLNKKVGLFDAMKQTGLDTGLTFEQINAAFKTPKTKPITDAAWLKQYQLRKNKASIDNLIENSNKNPLVKAWKALTRIPKAVTTAIHGHVFPGTHYSMGFLTPQDWGLYFKSYAVSARNAYGSDAFHEQEIQRITNNKNYPIARRAGLANDVERTDTDDFENAPKIFGKIGKTGTKGFLGLKDLRQNVFDRYWDTLPEDEKTDKVAESIAYLVNSATLASNIKIPAFAKEGLFSAGMESARWGKVFKNPTMAAAAATRITSALLKGAEIRPEDKIFVKIWGSRVGQQLATMAGLLALNAFIQSKVNPKNPVNLTDPTQSDYLNFKVGDQTVDLTGGVLGIKNFLLPITQFAVKDKNYKKEMGDIGGKVLQYGRNKLSPFYGDVADVAFGTDWAGNPTPFSNKTTSAGKHTLTWSEYLAGKAPIFASDALQNMFTSAEENGLPKTKTEKIVNQIINVGLTGGLGLHNHPSYQQPTPFTEEDKQDPTFKYFIEQWKMNLPNVSNNYTQIKDKSTHKERPLSEFSPEKQEQFNKVHKQFLKQELRIVKSRGYVYIDDYKNTSIEYSDGDKRIPISKLNDDQKAQILSLAQKSATKKSKLKIFGTD